MNTHDWVTIWFTPTDAYPTYDMWVPKGDVDGTNVHLLLREQAAVKFPAGIAESLLANYDCFTIEKPVCAVTPEPDGEKAVTPEPDDADKMAKPGKGAKNKGVK